MNIFQKVMVLFKAKGFVEDEIKEAKAMNNGTPGWKTSEFWMQLASQAGVLWAAVQGFIPPKYAAIITVVGTAVYTVSRTVYKAISDVKTAQAQGTGATVTATVTSTPSNG